jgi:hypothetical protein
MEGAFNCIVGLIILLVVPTIDGHPTYTTYEPLFPLMNITVGSQQVELKAFVHCNCRMMSLALRHLLTLASAAGDSSAPYRIFVNDPFTNSMSGRITSQQEGNHAMSIRFSQYIRYELPSDFKLPVGECRLYMLSLSSSRHCCAGYHI